MDKARSKKGTVSTKETPVDPKNRPIQSYRESDVSVSVWQREVNGRSYYSCSFERSYRDATGQWRYTRYFGLDDLGKVIALAQRASEYLESVTHGKALPPRVGEAD